MFEVDAIFQILELIYDFIIRSRVPTCCKVTYGGRKKNVFITIIIIVERDVRL